MNHAAFRPAEPRRIAPSLDTATVHLWSLARARGAGRAPLRALLAAYLDCDAANVRLLDEVHGRPRLAESSGLDFNWSHSAERAVVAIARSLPALGVDIEYQRTRRRVLELAQRFFTMHECAALARLPAGQRMPAFLRLWTAKEAVLKAQGRGLAYGLDRVGFQLVDGNARPHAFAGEVGDASRWQLQSFQPAAGFEGTLAWRGPPRHVAAYRFGGA